MRIRPIAHYLRRLVLGSVVMAAASGLSATASGAQEAFAETEPTVLTCLHRQPQKAALLRHALEPWGGEVQSRSGGALRIVWTHTPDDPFAALRRGEVPCAFATTPPDVWDTMLLELPFVLPLTSEAASRGGWDAVYQGVVPVVADIVPLAVVIEAPVPLIAVSQPPPMPQAMGEFSITVSTGAVAETFRALGASARVVSTDGAVSQVLERQTDLALVPMARVPDGSTILRLESDRALTGHVLLLAVSREWLSGRNPAQQSALTSDDPRRLSARGGRALDRQENVARHGRAGLMAIWSEAQLGPLRDAADAAIRSTVSAVEDGAARLDALRTLLDAAATR